jgi:hypothetical protein
MNNQLYIVTEFDCNYIYPSNVTRFYNYDEAYQRYMTVKTELITTQQDYVMNSLIKQDDCLDQTNIPCLHVTIQTIDHSINP